MTVKVKLINTEKSYLSSLWGVDIHDRDSNVSWSRKADIWKNIDMEYRRRSIVNPEKKMKKKIHVFWARRKEDRVHKDELS